MKKILAIGILITLVCGIGFAIAQTQSEDVVASTSLSAMGEKNYTYGVENDSKNITKLRQEIETQMEEYAWADEIEHNLAMGKYDIPPGFREYEPPKEPMPRPTPPVEQDRLIMAQDQEPPIGPMFPGICAGYQIFGKRYSWEWWKEYCGRVWCRTNSVPNLRENAEEYHVLHQFSSDSDENCIVITRSGDTGTFAIYISELGGYQCWKHYPADHLISIGIRPEHENEHREYTEIYFWVNDLTAQEYWSNTYTLPEEQSIKTVDAALEHDGEKAPNSLWKSFYEFSTYDKDMNCVNLETNFGWFEWSCPNMNNEHTEDYYYTVATLWQRKTPK